MPPALPASRNHTDDADPLTAPRAVVSGPRGVLRGARLWVALARCFHRVASADRRDLRRRGFPVVTDFALLEVLAAKGPQRARALGRAMLLTSGSVTAALDRVEKQGWVSRQRVEGDRRGVVIHLTAAGQAIVDEALPGHLETLETFFAPLDRSERKTLFQLLRKIDKHIQNNDL